MEKKETKTVAAMAKDMKEMMIKDTKEMKGYMGGSTQGNNSLAVTSQRIIPDDIECEEWLNEINMGQYLPTFLSNFTYGGKYLSRKRLQQVRLQDFPKMNITSFADQKILMEHIKLTLQHEYTNPERRRMSQILSPAKPPLVPVSPRADHKGEANARRSSKDSKDEDDKDENNQGGSRRNSKTLKKQESSSTTESIDQKKKAQRAIVKKRNSFDGKVWESIHKYRGTPKEETAPPQPADSKPKKPRRRSTFDGLPAANNDAMKAKLYGNMVKYILPLILIIYRPCNSIYYSRKCYKYKNVI